MAILWGSPETSDVAVYMQDLCNSGTFIGRVIITPKGDKILVYDLSCWTDQVSQQIRCQFPNTFVSVRESSTSMSGFVVVIEMAKGGNVDTVWSSILFLVLGMCTICGLSVFCVEEALKLVDGHTLMRMFL